MFRATRRSRLGRPYASSSQLDAGTVFVALLALRLVNALTLRTFFQPDEYYQALEPAWQIAFGQGSGAWITWEWHYRVRSSLHPAVFACTYAFVDAICNLFQCSVAVKSEALIIGPQVIQSIFAAIGDWCSWLLACSIYKTSYAEASWATLALTILSPWQWFCSTRTFSNSLETTLTVSALSLWPWQLLDNQKREDQSPKNSIDTNDNATFSSEDLWTLRLSLGLAALACILRPTNLIIWLCVSIPTLFNTNARTRLMLVSQSVICGSIVLMIASISDRIYYDTWTFPLLRFLNFNVTRSLAVFYGVNRRDYYLTEGLPLLLTTALPFAAAGIWNALFKLNSPKSQAQNAPKKQDKEPPVKIEDRSADIMDRRSDINFSALRVLALTCVIFLAVLSCIAHKEVRFIYPLLPILHVLAGRHLASLASSSSFILSFRPASARPQPRTLKKLKSVIILILVIINVFIAYYVSQTHQRGVVDVVHQIRKMHEDRLVATAEKSVFNPNLSMTAAVAAVAEDGVITSFAIFTPCHSTPWRSHLVHPALQGWALTCEPPVDVPADKRPEYMDEADVFYADPVAWIRQNMRSGPISFADGLADSGSAIKTDMLEETERRYWPSLIVMFAQLEDILGQIIQEKGYERCWSAFNTHWHDDWRRTGDVVIWCLEDTSSELKVPLSA